MKNIAKNGVLLTFVALMSAQATAQVTIEKLTLPQGILITREGEAELPWLETFNSRLGVNVLPNSVNVHDTGTPKLFYKDADGDPSENIKLRDNPALTAFDYDKEYQNVLRNLASKYDFEKMFLGTSEVRKMYGDDPEKGMREIAEGMVKKYKGVYEVALSSDPSVVKKLMNVYSLCIARRVSRC